MLHQLRLGPVSVDRSLYLPPSLLSLVEASRRGDDVLPALQGIVRGFGFEAFMYATAKFHLRPGNDERIWVVTTLPMAWVMRYDQRAYVECDPRVLAVFDSSMPLVWDQASERGRSGRSDEFLADAVAHGIGSGVAFAVYTTVPSRNIVSLSSATPIICKERRDEIIRSLGDIVLFGQYFHELFVKGAIEKGLTPTSVGVPLSLRERQCLELASQGYTSIEIGNKLGISDRTVNFHFSNMISKMGVHNRHEAIAKGARLGLFQSGT